MINGVIFDMDGTMFDTERMWATFWDPALKALGLPYKEGLAEAARGTAGETTRNVVRSFYSPPLSPKSRGWTPCWPGWTSSASPWPWLPPAGRP